jgi:putative MATE family efflux protein
MEGEPGLILAGEQPTSHVGSVGQSRAVIWSLAWPVIITMVSESVVGLVDMLFVARLGAPSVAAVGVGAQVLGGVSVTMTAVGTGTLALVARAIGGNRLEEAEHVLGQSIVVAVLLATSVIIPVIVFAHPLVHAFGVEPHVVELSTGFVRIVMLSIPASATIFVIASALRGMGDMRTPLMVGVTVNVLNTVFNYIFIFGKLGFPALGVRGSSLATTVAFSFGVSFALSLVASGRLRLRLRRADLRLRLHTVKRVLAIGYPTALEQLMMQLGFFIYLLFAARYGTDAVAAYFIGVRILALSFLPGFGFAAAAAALVGQNLGAGSARGAETSGWHAAWMAVALMSTTGIVFFLLAEPIARLFVDTPEVIAGTVAFIHMLAASQPFMAMDFTLGGALRGAGDTRFPLLTVLVAFYGCRLGMALLVVGVLHLSLVWLWASLIGDYIARASLKAWRFKQGAWQAIAV